MHAPQIVCDLYMLKKMINYQGKREEEKKIVLTYLQIAFNSSPSEFSRHKLNVYTGDIFKWSLGGPYSGWSPPTGTAPFHSAAETISSPPSSLSPSRPLSLSLSLSPASTIDHPRCELVHHENELRQSRTTSSSPLLLQHLGKRKKIT